MLLESLLKIEATVDRLTTKMEVLMAKAQDFQNLVTALNAETDRLAAKLQTLIDKINASGMSGMEEDEVLNTLTSVVDRLKTVGADPSEPIPEPGPGE